MQLPKNVLHFLPELGLERGAAYDPVIERPGLLDKLDGRGVTPARLSMTLRLTVELLVTDARLLSALAVQIF